MTDERSSGAKLEIAHVLLIDIVGYSRLLIDDQQAVVRQLSAVVRGSAEFQAANEAGKLVRLPTGDGIALIFFTTPEAPVRCALEIDRGLRWREPSLQVRMGIHSGPVTYVKDVDEGTNVAGAGINLAQRVMDCGDAGHILLSHRIAEDIGQFREWLPHLHDIGECGVKHGVR
jgi:class 3 adenylate cyclase